MIAVIQRIHSAHVIADGVPAGKAGRGLYILLGVASGDTTEDAVALAEKISKLRIFTDENDKMNLSVKDIDGEVLVVSNFTLNANYAHGNRPDYLAAASPDEANALYTHFVLEMKKRVRSCEVIISIISPFCGILSIGTMTPFTLAPTILLPTAEWIA